MTEVPVGGAGIRRGRRWEGSSKDHTDIGEVSDPVFVRLPNPATVFASRSRRFAALGAGNALGPYLGFLSYLADVQHAAQSALPLPTPLVEARPAAQSANAVPPLSRAPLFEDDCFIRILEWFIQHAATPDAPEAANQARLRLDAMAWPERLSLAGAVLESCYPAEQLGECLYVAAALQIHVTCLAARLDAKSLVPVADGCCPVCESGPVASMIVAAPNADRARYCCCSLCATLWNHVRIKCTACGSTSGISYYHIQGQSSDIAVETCTTCRSYIKHFHQHRTSEIEPFADDIASFGLDMLVREKDFRRATTNPFMVWQP